MADFVSHHLFGEQALPVFPMPAQRAAARRPACFFWGCQGPDPLFYRKIVFGSPLHKTGNRMHSEKTAELFAALARTVHCLSDEAREMAEAYFYGFLCHYALDSEIHPYVYCRQEQLHSANVRLLSSAIHCEIETDIDCVLYQRHTGRAVTTFKPGDHYQLDSAELAVLACILRAVLLSVYGEDVPTHDLRRAFEEMLSWQEFFYAEHRTVYHGAQNIERLLGRGALISGHMKTAYPSWDCLNDDHAPWYNLERPNEVRTESVEDLFSLARIRAAALAGQYAAQFDASLQLQQAFPLPFDYGSPRRV